MWVLFVILFSFSDGFPEYEAEVQAALFTLENSGADLNAERKKWNKLESQKKRAVSKYLRQHRSELSLSQRNALKSFNNAQKKQRKGVKGREKQQKIFFDQKKMRFNFMNEQKKIKKDIEATLRDQELKFKAFMKEKRQLFNDKFKSIKKKKAKLRRAAAKVVNPVLEEFKQIPKGRGMLLEPVK